MDLQDVSLFVVALAGVMVMIGVLEASRPWRGWLRVITEAVLIFVTCSVGQIIGRHYFGAGRGVDFTRVFIYAGMGFLLYILARIYQDYQQRASSTAKETA